MDDLAFTIMNSMEIEESGDLSMALDILYDAVDKRLHAGELAEIDWILKKSSPAFLTTDIILALLTVTMPVKTKLYNRESFFQKSKQVILERHKTDGLLDGLE